MSYDATKWTWSAPVENAGQRLVLLTLADRANSKAECWPSQKRIARDTRLAERTVRARLAELEALGLIKRKHRNSAASKTSDLITLITGKVTSAGFEKANALPANNAASLSCDAFRACLPT